MSIWLADVNGSIVKAIVNRDLPDFIKKVKILEENRREINPINRYVTSCSLQFHPQL